MPPELDESEQQLDKAATASSSETLFAQYMSIIDADKVKLPQHSRPAGGTKDDRLSEDRTPGQDKSGKNTDVSGTPPNPGSMPKTGDFARPGDPRKPGDPARPGDPAKSGDPARPGDPAKSGDSRKPGDSSKNLPGKPADSDVDPEPPGKAKSRRPDERDEDDPEPPKHRRSSGANPGIQRPGGKPPGPQVPDAPRVTPPRAEDLRPTPGGGGKPGAPGAPGRAGADSADVPETDSEKQPRLPESAPGQSEKPGDELRKNGDPSRYLPALELIY